MKKLWLIAAMFLPLITLAQKPMPKTFDVIIGTYTSGTSKGIYVYRFYAEKGKLAYLSQIDGVDNPSYLTASANNKFVYAVNEQTKGEVSAFKFDAPTGKLEFINKKSTLGADPCHISVDKEQRNLFVANYSSGNVAVFPLAKDGSIQDCMETEKDDTHGPDKARQEGPHAHMAYFSPDEKYLLYDDLGADKINIFKYKPNGDPRITNKTSVSLTPGSGPRHADFSPDHKYLYVVSELSSTVNTFAYNNGHLKQIQSVTLLADGFKGQSGAAAIHVSPDGKFVYASNRLDTNEIIVYAVDPTTGMLTFVQRQPTYGKNPRDFAIDPTGSWMIVANQGSDSMYIFRINKESGKISMLMNSKVEIGNPVCIKFVPAE